MLVLDRKKDQTIVIGDQIEIVVKRIRGSHVAIGIAAPKEVAIRRGELPAEPRKPDAA